MNDKKLTAKQYLDQLRVIDTKINQKMEELADLMTAATSTGAIDYSKDRVQTSPQNAQENRICKYVDLDAEILQLQAERHEIVHTLEQLQVDEFWILNEVYGKHVSVGQAAWDRGRSYSWARALHNRALENLEKLLNGYIV